VGPESSSEDTARCVPLEHPRHATAQMTTVAGVRHRARFIDNADWTWLPRRTSLLEEEERAVLARYKDVDQTISVEIGGRQRPTKSYF
jgi:hypothetical protein